MTAFISRYANGLTDARYPGFSSDAMAALERCIMDADCWSEGKVVVGRCLHRSRLGLGLWGWFDAAGGFSASMIFCLKYLPAEAVGGWMASLFAIECPHWRAQLIAWLVGAHGVLTGDIRQPSDFGSASPPIKWDWSHGLRGNDTGDLGGSVVIGHLLPAENHRLALEAVLRALREDVVLDWLIGIADVEGLDDDLADLPERFVDLHARLGKPAN